MGYSGFYLIKADFILCLTPRFRSNDDYELTSYLWKLFATLKLRLSDVLNSFIRIFFADAMFSGYPVMTNLMSSSSQMFMTILQAVSCSAAVSFFFSFFGVELLLSS